MKVLEVYFELYHPFLQRASPLLIFGADETMLETLLETKVIVPNDVVEAIAAEVENFPHISVMCCHSIYGAVIPPFMILPTLNQLPDDLKILADLQVI